MVRRDIDSETVVAAFQAGRSMTALADDYSCSPGTIKRLLIREGVMEAPRPTVDASGPDPAQAAALYSRGSTIAAIANELETSVWKVARALDHAGVVRRGHAEYASSGLRVDIDEHAGEIARLYREEGLDTRALAERYACGRDIIRRILKERKVEPIRAAAGNRRPGYRTCARCREEKPEAEFYLRKDRNSGRGRLSDCIPCLSRKQAQRYASDPDYYRQRSRTYYNADIERGRRIAARWRKRNPDTVRATWREWYLANTEERRAYAEGNKERFSAVRREWAQTERGQTSRRAASSRRRARLIEATTEEEVDTELLLALRAATQACEICAGELNYDTRGAVHLDHIVPLAAGGLHCPDNLRYICGPCNLARPKDGRDVPDDHPARRAHS